MRSESFGVGHPRNLGIFQLSAGIWLDQLIFFFSIINFTKYKMNAVYRSKYSKHLLLSVLTV